MYRKIVELIDRDALFSVATVLATEGSTPQVAGARAIIESSGCIWGTVGGGPVEAEVQRLALKACQSQSPCVLDFSLSNTDAAADGAICGGHMRILIDSTVARYRACFLQAADAWTNRKRGYLITRIRRDPQIQVEIEWQTTLTLTLSHEWERETFIESIVPCPRLLIAGGGHIGQALADLASRMDFDITVIDDRLEFVAANLFPPGVRGICGNISQQITACDLDQDTYVVLVTRGHQQDAEALAACIHRPLAYLGMIGSHRKVAMLREKFLESGQATAEEFDRVHAPIGLKIGAVTVPEIAVSIMAQLIAVRRKADTE